MALQPERKIEPIDGLCDVCEKNARGFVAAGPGPCSYFYCIACLKAGVSPFHGLVAYLYTLPWDDIDTGMQEHVRKSCAYVGKTVEDFRDECAKGLREFEDYMKNEVAEMQAGQDATDHFGTVGDWRGILGGMKL